MFANRSCCPLPSDYASYADDDLAPPLGQFSRSGEDLTPTQPQNWNLNPRASESENHSHHHFRYFHPTKPPSEAVDSPPDAVVMTHSIR